MTAYEQAWQEYHRYGEPGWAWHEIIGAHFRCGAVVSTPDAFILARRVNVADDDAFILSPLESREDGDCWMVWLAAGKLDALISLWEGHTTEWVCYTRRDSTVLRRVKSSIFLRRHGIAENAKTAAARASARVIDRAGEGGR